MTVSRSGPGQPGQAEALSAAPPEGGAGAGRLLERLRRENEELRAAVQARDEFISVAAHELRNPMTPLLAQIEILRNVARQAGDAVPERLAKGLERLDVMAAHYIKRATTLLDISRLTSGQFRLEPAKLDAASLVREVAASLAPYAELAGCPLSVEAAGTLVGMWDRLAIEQITDNLLSNAIKYGTGRPIRLALAREGPWARLSVADQGVGISPDDQARIFDRFERAITRERAGGFGIGLWVVGRLVDMMGGDISVESQPGNGSTFTVRLPIHADVEDL